MNAEYIKTILASIQTAEATLAAIKHGAQIKDIIAEAVGTEAYITEAEAAEAVLFHHRMLSDYVAKKIA